jgi:hypothetical protein
MREWLITFKFPLRIFAIIGICYLSMSTCIFTYKAGGDIWNFFHLGHVAPSRTGRSIAGVMGILVGLATFVQIGPIIWDRLSKWGQDLDNVAAKIFSKKLYFLDQVEESLQKIRKIINTINSTVHDIHWRLSLDTSIGKQSRMKMLHTLENILHKDLAEADRQYNQTIKLMKENEAYDNINRERKAKGDEDINTLTIQLTDSCVKIKRLINQLQPSEVIPKDEKKHAETLS